MDISPDNPSIDGIREKAERISSGIGRYYKSNVANARISREDKEGISVELSKILYWVESALFLLEQGHSSEAMALLLEAENRLAFSSVLHPEEIERVVKTKQKVRNIRESIRL